MTDLTKVDRRAMRILRFLERGTAAKRPAASAEYVLLDAGGRGVLGEKAALLDALAGDGLIAETDGGVALTDSGRVAAGRLERPVDPLAAPRPNRETRSVVTEAGAEAIVVNDAESPLALLGRRKNRDGRPFLTVKEFRAGERLRADYSRGQIMPRLGVNWSSVGGSPGFSDANGLADLTDAALAARQRVERAISAVGPELSGVLIDVCCFLKGLERVEAERGWPVRSAKIVLKSALSALSRHYEPPAQEKAGGSGIVHWGAADYRPTI